MECKLLVDVRREDGATRGVDDGIAKAIAGETVSTPVTTPRLPGVSLEGTVLNALVRHVDPLA